MFFMMNLKDTVKAWADHLGVEVAIGRLVTRRVSTRAAEMLCKGEYGPEPKSLRTVLIDEMSKDGFVAKDGKAS